ncbi:MAG: isocitrate/isopropylmalate family dehydrogenase [Bacteroidia bacterium]|nr:isocitrate/isopropylmalate family dehydrogenase [Bacteroidia bacterium]
MNQTVTLIPGDGIGPEIVESVKRIFSAANVGIDWEEINAGTEVFEKTGEAIPKALLDSIERNLTALKGPISTPVGKGFRSVNVTLRKEFELYINLRPAKSIPGIQTRFENVDIVLFRENIEGLYAGLELWDEQNQIADAIKRVTRQGSQRIIRSAFEYARKHNRKTVHIIHKANILKIAYGLFLNIGREIAIEYPEITCKDIIIDNCCMQLVTRPEQFDVMVTTNLFGDILSDLCAGLVGGLGIAPGANLGEKIAIFESVHGSAPDIAGQGKANPTAILRSGLMLLEHLGKKELAAKIEQALMNVLATPERRTKDLGGTANTVQFTNYILDELNRL